MMKHKTWGAPGWLAQLEEHETLDLGGRDDPPQKKS